MADTIAFTTTPSGTEAPAPAPAPPPEPAERPAWLPENFKSVEDYAKSLADTKAELTRAQQELAKFKKPAEGDPAKPAETPKTPDDLTIKEGEGEKTKEDEAAEKVAKEAGIDFVPYQDEFTKTGDVSEENRVGIAEKLKGVFGENARSIVDEYIEGAKSRAANARSQIVGVAGGDEGYNAMLAWAAQNLSAEDKAVYNKQVNSGDFHTAMFAAQGLKARYEAQKGRTPKLVSGDGLPADSAGAFKSLHEMTTAIKDPRYSTDPDYRKSVEQRVAKSNF